MKLWLEALALSCMPLAPALADAPAPPADSCSLAPARRYIGAQDMPAVRGALGQIARANPVRWIKPGQPITMDFNPRRLNVILDEQGRIAAMRCG